MTAILHEGNNGHQRGGIAAFLALAAGAAVVSEVAAPAIWNRKGQTTFNGSGSTVIFPGLKCANADFLVGPVETMFGESATSTHYARSGLCVDEIGERLSEKLESIPQRGWRLVGHSLGTKTALYAIEAALNQGRPIKPITEMWIHSSPLHKTDIIGADNYERLPSIFQFVGGRISKLVGTVLTDTWNMPNPLSHVMCQVRETVLHDKEIQNSRQWATQLAIGLSPRPIDFDLMARTGVIGPNTNVYGIYHGGDQVVAAERAWSNIATRLGGVGARCHLYMDEKPIHVDASDLSPAVRQVFAKSKDAPPVLAA